MQSSTVSAEGISADFQTSIYAELDARLKGANAEIGAAELHGILCGALCRGVEAAQLRLIMEPAEQAEQPEFTQAIDLDIVGGLGELLARDLRADGFAFNLLLPAEVDANRLVAVREWCSGFLHGFMSFGEPPKLSAIGGEALQDISNICGLEILTDQLPDAAELETQLSEIEEFLRVAVQLIFEELNPLPDTPDER